MSDKITGHFCLHLQKFNDNHLRTEYARMVMYVHAKKNLAL